MAPIMRFFLCLVVVAVAMVTAAPVANERLMKTDSSDDLDRGKRAEEMVYFGNQQNKARPPVKKSDPSHVLDLPDAGAAQGENDVDGEVIAHEETPITADLEDRVTSLAENGDQQAKLNDAVESAMHEAVSSAFTEPQAEGGDSSPASEESTSAEANGNEDAAAEVVDVDGSVAGNDVEKELEEATAAEGEDEGEAEALANSSDESTPDAGTGTQLEPVAGEGQDEVEDFLEQLQKEGDSENKFDGPSEAGSSLNNYYKNMYQYMVSSGGYPEEQEGYQNYPYLPIYYRKRRSSRGFHGNQRPLGLRSNRHTRRIKRDLFDGLGIPAMEMDNSYLPDLDDYLSLSEEQVKYLYSRLLPYLAEAYAEDAIDEDRNTYNTVDLDALKQYSLLGELEPEEEVAYQQEIPVYQERPYEEFEPSLQADNEYPLEKRGMMDYYAASPNKRPFFPFSDEPETHWGAFVPEKRDYDEKRGYNEAIHRLQRLALDLNDEPGPYYTEMIGEYRKK